MTGRRKRFARLVRRAEKAHRWRCYVGEIAAMRRRARAIYDKHMAREQAELRRAIERRVNDGAVFGLPPGVEFRIEKPRLIHEPKASRHPVDVAIERAIIGKVRG